MKRVVTAILLVPAAVYSALFAPWWLCFAVIALVALLCFHEYASITQSFAPLGYVAGLLILLAPQHETILLIILSTLAAMCLTLAAGENLMQGFARNAALVLGIIYIFGAWKTGILLHDINPNWLMFGLLVNWVGDTGAYYVGRKFGKHKLAPAVSPGKSWEGAAASVATGVAFGMIYLPLTIKGTSLVAAGLLALAANVAGQVGDLAESAIKRGAGVKDSGSLLPGHGGMLDRVDSTLFALPVLYSLLTFLR
jgi:phosphatidate cytidylyltransferase